jgi:hypothetical protein
MPQTPTKLIDDNLRNAWSEGLQKLSEMILQEGRNLMPHPSLMASSETGRTDGLWRKYTRTGKVYLSNGGVEESLLSGDDVRSENTGSFNLYRSDRLTSTVLDDDKVKQFLMEEGVVDVMDADKIFVEFSLGSHEGFTRLIKCLHSDKTAGMLYPMCGYGLLVRAASTAETGKYNVHLVGVDRKNGDKILLESLAEEAKKHPKAKVLYIECKTMCGAVYEAEEIEEIVKFCKERGIFMIMDMAHINMELSPKHKFPTITEICRYHDYSDYAVIVTGSKTYGLERARVGFVVSGNESVIERMHNDMHKTLGSMGDMPIDVANALVTSSPADRKAFCAENIERHRLNMNVLIAYIEGIDSPKVDPDLRKAVESIIPPEYQGGINGLEVFYKPESGIQLKVDTSELKDKYLGNIRMFNSEILSYAIHAATGVVTLHAYQIMDTSGDSLRLSFSILDDIHKGMQEMHNFINYGLSDEPQPNPFMPGVALAEDLVFPSISQIEDKVAQSRFDIADIDADKAQAEYRAKVAGQVPSHVLIGMNRADLNDAVDTAASMIQIGWKKHRDEVNAGAGVRTSPSPSPAAEAEAKKLAAADLVTSHPNSVERYN